MTDYLEILFGQELTAEEVAENAAYVARCEAEETARKAAVAAAALRAEERRLRPICGKRHGSGRIGAFAHVAGGVCFACGGDGRK